MFIRPLIIAGIASIFAAAPASATVTYSVVFDGATLHDYGGFDIGSYGSSFSLTTATPITAAVSLATDSCSLSPTAAALYSCGPTLDFDPILYAPDSDYIGFNAVNNDASGSSTGFLFFDPGSFTANGVYTIDATPPAGYGSFAQTATLTVSGIEAVPEPASLAALAVALLGLGAVRRRGG